MYDNLQFKKTHEVNKETFSQLLLAAKGNRTLTDFAHECETYPSTFTRIIQGANKGASSPKLLQAIASKADPKSLVTIELLADANGYTISPLVTLTGLDLEYAVQNALVTTLMLNCTNVSVSWPRFHIGTSTRLSPDFLITTDAFGGGDRPWFIEIIAFNALEKQAHLKHQVIRKTLECLSRFMILGTNVEELRAHPARYSIVVVSRSIYDIIYEEFKDVVVRDDVSILFVDPSNRSIEAEFLLPHIDAGHRDPFFMTPTLKYAADEFGNKEDTL